MTIDGYVNLISSLPSSQEAQFYTATNLKKAFYCCTEILNSGNVLNYALLDINLPVYKKQHLYNGIDLALLIRASFPLCKLIFITMHNEPLWVNKIIQSVNPEGLISKNDLTFRTFPFAYNNIEKGEYYYSKSVIDAHKSILSQNLKIDQFDSKILLLLADGIKTVNLPDFIGLSLSAIEKRKAALKQRLIFVGASDQELIHSARALGLI